MEDSLLFKLFSLLPENATDAEIENAYKALAQIYHPDKNPGRIPWANEKMKQLNEAKQLLQDPNRKAFYIKEMKDKKTRERDLADNARKVTNENAVLRQDLQRNKETTGAVAAIFLLLGVMLFSDE